MGDDEEEPVDTGFGLKPVTWGEGEKWYGLDKATGVSYECAWARSPVASKRRTGPTENRYGRTGRVQI